MRIYIENGDKRQGFAFPMTPMQIRDVLDRMNIQNGSEVKCRFSSYVREKLFGTEQNRWYTADIYKLNLFAERYEVELEYSEQAALKSVLREQPDSSIDDMLAMTYGIGSVTAIPCYNTECLGKIAVENGTLSELKGVPTEFLDYYKIGKAVIERGEGVLIDEFFCKPKEYRRPDIDIEIDVPEKEFFRMLVAPSAHDMDKAQWVSLPRDEQVLYDMAKGCGLPAEGLYFAEIESALPTFNEGSYVDEGWLDDIIEISKELAEMPHHKFVKVKAIMVMNNAEVTGEVFDAISTVNEYDFDPMVQDESQFGKAYACRVFPTNFDWNVIKDCDMHDFGKAVLERKIGMVTEYGAITDRGHKLYTTLTPKQEQAEDETEDEDISEEDEIQIGGMTQ
ncbi:MAG: hypothetical protein IJ555_14480 [Ruminococcus sp.]|nr:hypothetical protein [Ruminococcus sp.]